MKLVLIGRHVIIVQVVVPIKKQQTIIVFVLVVIVKVIMIVVKLVVRKKGCIGHKFFPTPLLRSNTGRNIHIDPDNFDTDIEIYNSFFGWKEEDDNGNNTEVDDDDVS